MESPNTNLYPRFSDVEIERRRALVAEFIEERELDGLVVFGWSAQNRTAQADVYYLSGYLGMRDNYVVALRRRCRRHSSPRATTTCQTQPRSPFSMM